MNTKQIDEKSYINIALYDIIFITKEYEKFIASNKIFNTLVMISDKIFFRYNVKEKSILVYNGKRTIFSGSMELYRTTMIESGSIEDSSMQQFRQMCDEIAEAKGEGFYKIKTTFFNSESDTAYYPTVVTFAPVEFNSQIDCVVGLISGGTSGSSVDTYTSNRSNLDPLTNLLNKKAIKDYALETLAKASKDNSVVTLVMIDLDNFKTINDIIKLH